MLSIFGGLAAIAAGAALAYFLWDVGGRGAGKLFILGIIIALGGIGAVFNGITGNFGDDEEKPEEDEEDEDRGDWDDEDR